MSIYSLMYWYKSETYGNIINELSLSPVIGVFGYTAAAHREIVPSALLYVSEHITAHTYVNVFERGVDYVIEINVFLQRLARQRAVLDLTLTAVIVSAYRFDDLHD